MELIEIIYVSNEGMLEAEIKPEKQMGAIHYNVEINGCQAFIFLFEQNDWEIIKLDNTLFTSEILLKKIIGHIKWELNKCLCMN